MQPYENVGRPLIRTDFAGSTHHLMAGTVPVVVGAHLVHDNGRVFVCGGYSREMSLYGHFLDQEGKRAPSQGFQPLAKFPEVRWVPAA